MVEEKFRQAGQKAQGILCVLPSIFGSYGGIWTGQIPLFDLIRTFKTKNALSLLAQGEQKSVVPPEFRYFVSALDADNEANRQRLLQVQRQNSGTTFPVPIESLAPTGFSLHPGARVLLPFCVICIFVRYFM